MSASALTSVFCKFNIFAWSVTRAFFIFPANRTYNRAPSISLPGPGSRRSSFHMADDVRSNFSAFSAASTSKYVNKLFTNRDRPVGQQLLKGLIWTKFVRVMTRSCFLGATGRTFLIFQYVALYFFIWYLVYLCIVKINYVRTIGCKFCHVLFQACYWLWQRILPPPWQRLSDHLLKNWRLPSSGCWFTDIACSPRFNNRDRWGWKSLTPHHLLWSEA